EGRLWFDDAYLGSLHLGRISRHEVVHRLSRSQPTHGGKNSKGIAREKYDVPWMASHAGNLRVWDVLDRVAAPRVFRDRNVGKVYIACVRVENHVFENGPKA